MDDLNKAIEIALDAHKGQLDKAGKPYILHPLYLMMQCTDNSHRIVAVLYDVIEDSNITLEFLEDYFSDEILNAIDCLTHRKHESYTQYIDRIKDYPYSIVREIKKLDLRHNGDLSRLKEVIQKDYERVEKYKKAYYILCE